MKISSKLIPLLLSAALIIVSAGCGSKKENGNSENLSYETALEKYKGEDESLSYENEKYSMTWNYNDCNIILKDKTSGNIWSTSPVDENGAVTANEVFSPVNIEYIKRSGFRTIELLGKTGSVDNGGYTSKKIDNGVRITFFFSEVSIAVPIDFILSEQGLQVTVNSDEIAENIDSDSRIFSVTPVPYLCRVGNNKENYFVVPSGSGAVMYADERGDGVGRKYSDYIYGDDPAQEKDEMFTNVQSIKMAAYAAVSGKSTLSAIVTNGSEGAALTAMAGDKEFGCSYINSSFRLRGYNGTILDYGGSTGKKLVNYYKDEKLKNREFTVCYSPSSDKSNGYMALAEDYRNFLTDKYGVKSIENNSLLSLKIYGGIEIKKFLFGVPYYDVEALTTFKDAEKIIQTVCDETKQENINIQAVGFGKSGLSNGKLGGGFEFDSCMGNKSDLEDLLALKDGKIYFDYDIVRFGKSGNGFSATTDVAHTANGYPAYVYDYDPATGAQVKGHYQSVLLERATLGKAVTKLLSAVSSKGIKNISLSSFSNTAYSDYSSEQYSVRGGMSEQFTELTDKIKEQGIGLSASSPNDYALKNLDVIFDMPNSSSAKNCFDFDIPLYQMVLKGLIPFSEESINTSGDSLNSFLHSLETGSSLQFSLSGQYDTDYASYLNDEIALTVFDNNIDMIKEYVEKAEGYLSSVKNAKIIDYYILSDNVRATYYDNGTVVYVNYGDSAYSNGTVTVEAKNFKAVKQSV